MIKNNSAEVISRINDMVTQNTHDTNTKQVLINKKINIPEMRRVKCSFSHRILDKDRQQSG